MRCGWLFLSLVMACGGRTAPHTADAGGEGPVLDAPPAELCNDLDEDGDGRIDEGLVPASFGAPVRIRTNERATGDCPRCRWARTTALLPTRDGMRALMAVFDGGASAPSLFARSLDRNGEPLGSWEPLFEAPSVDWFPGLNRDPAGHGIGTIVRRDGADWLAGGRLDAEGSLDRFTAFRVAADRRHPPRVVAAGDGLLAVHECGGDLCLTRLGGPAPAPLEPLSASARILDPSEGAELSSPAIDGREGRLALAALAVHPEESAALLFFRLDAEGRVRSERAIELPSEGFRYRPFDTVHLLATDSGFFVMFTRRDAGSPGEPAGRWVARFDRSGELVDGPTSFEPEHFYYGSATTLQAHPAGGFLLSGLRATDRPPEPRMAEGYVAYLDDAGRMQWDTVVPGIVDGAVVLDDGRIFAIRNPGLTSGEANPLDVFELRCIPI